MITLDSVNVTYGKGETKIHALHDISLKCDPGQIISLTGKSGAGKSTLLKVIAGYLAPQSGQVLIENLDIYKMSQDKRIRMCSRKIGFVFQDFQLVSDMTAEQNILLPTWIHQEKVDESYLRQIVSMLGISNRLDHYPAQLSGGEQQRCAIARALILKPALVLADEPTGQLDYATSMATVEVIKSANEEFHQAFIIASHDREIAQVGHVHLHLQDGRFVS